MYSTHNPQNWITSPSRIAVNGRGAMETMPLSFAVDEPYLPEILSDEEDRWVRMAFNVRVQYYYHKAPKELLAAWAGACWCSDAPIGDFAYGPGPDDPRLAARLVREFLICMRAM